MEKKTKIQIITDVWNTTFDKLVRCEIDEQLYKVYLIDSKNKKERDEWKKRNAENVKAMKTYKIILKVLEGLMEKTN
jgi:hypothetical protein